MANERLRASMVVRRYAPERLAAVLAVDPKTVQRWIAGRTPHPRHRWAVADVLEEDEHYLWPPEQSGGLAASPEVELVAAQAHRADVPTDRWWSCSWEHGSASIFSATPCSSCGSSTRSFPSSCSARRRRAARYVSLADPNSPEACERDAEEGLAGGLQARIRTARLYLRCIDAAPGVALHFHRTPMYNSIFRCDENMFVTPHLYGVPGYTAPLLHLRRKGGQGMFDGFAAHFEAIWSTSRPAPVLAPAAGPSADVAARG